MDWWMVLVIPLVAIIMLMWMLVLIYKLDREINKRKGEEEWESQTMTKWEKC